jgi:succinate dehydrogenase/fumarate reductase cytochrome b subunit (b558 family)
MTVEAQRAPFLAPARRDFLLRRLHGLSGVFPVGAFLVEHLWTNAKALKGQANFDQAVEDINHLPLLPLLEIFGIFLPLAFHALYGVKLAFEARPNVARYPYSRNVFYALQRVTGLIAFAFIVWHLWEFRVAKLLGRMSANAFYPTLEAHLSSNYGGVPVLAIVYLVGIAASVVHFANGLLTFAFSWGICVTRRSQRILGTAFAAFGLVVFLLGAETTFYFATGAGLSTLAGLHSSSTTPQCSVVDPPPRPAASAATPAP